MFNKELSIFNEATKKYIDNQSSKGNDNVVSAFNDIFKDINKIHKVENNYIYVVVKDSLTKFKVDKFYSLSLNDYVKELTNGELGLKFITFEDAKKEESTLPPAQDKEAIDPERSKRLLRPEFTFENFVVGESNRFAYTEARQVANSPYASFNPLYIMGNVGIGKTHLMQAVGHYVLDNNIKANIVYTSANQFADDYFRAMSSKNAEDRINFSKYYENADVLLFDDVQLLEGKEKTQEVFFKFFDYLHEHNKQIVVTSDRPANDLKIMARLKSRFSWGEIVQMGVPDITLRINILKRKLSFLIANPNDVPDEVLEKIASVYKNNVRELEGALRTYINYCLSFESSFSVDNIQKALGSHLPKDASAFKNDDVKCIKEVLCNYFRISEKDLISDSRKSQLVYARSLAFYLMREDLGLQLKEIGVLFGDRDHSTILHGYDKIKELLENDTQVVSDIDYIRKKFKESLTLND